MEDGLSNQREESLRLPKSVWTEADFDDVCWHDCHVWGIQFRSGAPDRGDWTSDLILDLDFICEWRCGGDGCKFLVAPALLTFHGVTAPKITIDWGASSLIHELSIAEIHRKSVAAGAIDASKPNFRWTILANWPESGEITFFAHGFTQTLRSQPVLLDEQRFSFEARQHLLGRLPP